MRHLWEKWVYCKLLRDHRQLRLEPSPNGWWYRCHTCGKTWWEERADG